MEVPPNGWFRMENAIKIRMMTGGTPMTQQTSISGVFGYPLVSSNMAGRKIPKGEVLTVVTCSNSKKGT